jgi:sporulation protein YlmC with PRC-barrel domain
MLADGQRRAIVAFLLFSFLCIAETAMSQEPPAPGTSGTQSQAAQDGEKASQPEATAPQSQPQASQAQPPQSAQPPLPQPQPPQPEQGAAKPQTPTIVLDSQDVQGILGKEALGRTGEKMGQIVDVMVDKSGRIRAAIIDFGGFLGVGSRKIAVDWRAVHFVPGGKTIRIILDLTREDVVGSHEYKPSDQITILEPKTEPPTPENAEPKSAPPAPEQ